MTSAGGEYEPSVAGRIWAAVLLAVIFAALAVGSLFTVVGQNLDNLSMEALQSLFRPAVGTFTPLLKLVTVPSLVAVSALVLVLAGLRKDFPAGLRALGVILGANVSAQLIKEGLARPDLEVGWALPNSYPSGHVTYIAALAVALIFVSPRRFRTILAILAWVASFAIGTIVISLGWHRLADVVGAFLLVAIWMLLLAPRARLGAQQTSSGVALGVSVVLLTFGLLALPVSAALFGVPLTVPLSWAELGELTSPVNRISFLFGGASLATIAGSAGLVADNASRMAGRH